MDSLRAEIRQYGPGKKLTLFPHSPPDPHGRSTYKVPDALKENSFLSDREEVMSMAALCFDNDNQPHLLDTSQHNDPDNSLGVEIIESLSSRKDGDNQVLLVRILLRPTSSSTFPRPKNWRLSRSLTPFSTRRISHREADFEGKTRHVGLVLIEYIQGTSIRDLCHHGADEVLIPPRGRVCLHSDGPDFFNFDEEKLLGILALLLAGVVE
ncbi:hypothetical protein CMEL01_15141 [Colletotrichum melonis]|uniref:Uncharacterized protein n=1 Tax=Colletotrichum melonis TaxID=1209925 RepID=A0AAI9XUP7_9PEZI|nr:hypothetical protein CMEL01_15141 [Colletotrichum melonis]